jgi:hypothetical protein
MPIGPFVALANGRSSAGGSGSMGETPDIEVVMSTASDRKESTEHVRTAADALAE